MNMYIDIESQENAITENYDTTSKKQNQVHTTPDYFCQIFFCQFLLLFCRNV